MKTFTPPPSPSESISLLIDIFKPKWMYVMISLLIFNTVPVQTKAQCEAPENYAPIDSNYNPIKTIKLVYHVLCKTYSEPGNIPESDPCAIGWLTTGATSCGLPGVLNDLNGKVKGNKIANPEAPFTTFIKDTRIRFEVEDVFWYYDLGDYNLLANNPLSNMQYLYTKYIDVPSAPAYNLRQYLHVWLTPNNNGTAYDAKYGYEGFKGLAYDIPIMDGEPGMTYVCNVGTAFRDSKLKPTESTHWIVSSYILHETMHCLGLDHTWSAAQCSDFLHYKGKTNNVMDYWPSGQESLTSCQLGIAHANFYRVGTSSSRTAEFLKKDWCTIQPNSTITIWPGQHIVWQSEKWLKGSIVIKKGGSLTIKCKISFPQDALILVEEGGMLTVDGGTLTNKHGNVNDLTACNFFWKGIIVNGNPLAPLDGSEELNGVHGMVILNNATIEYAEIGIDGYTGGIVMIDQSTIQNCWKGVIIRGNYNQTNLSSVSRSTFKCTGLLEGSVNHYNEFTTSFLQITAIDGVKVAGNTFENIATTPINKYRGIGIDGYDSRIFITNIKPKTSPANIPCDFPEGAQNTFEGLTEGISLDNNNGKSVFITGNKITNCQKAIKIGGCIDEAPSIIIAENEIIYNSNFNPFTGIYNAQTYPLLGIWTNDADNYQILDNIITFEDGSYNIINGTGLSFIAIKNENTENFGINYENKISDENTTRTAKGVVITGKKYSVNKVHITYNTFTDLYADIFIEDLISCTGVIDQTGIDLSGVPLQDAGNVFSSTPIYFNIVNLYSTINYYSGVAYTQIGVNSLPGTPHTYSPTSKCAIYGGNHIDSKGLTDWEKILNIIRFNDSTQRNVPDILTEASVKIYPNPAKDKVTIEYTTANKEANIELSFYLIDITGRLVLMKTIHAADGKFNIQLPPSLSEGLYRAIINIQGAPKLSENIIILK